MMLNIGKMIDIQKEIESKLSFQLDKNNISLDLHFDESENDSKFKFNLNLVKTYVEKIKNLYPNINFNIKVKYVMDENYILDTDKCKDLEMIDNYLREKENNELYISSKKEQLQTYGFRKTLNANRKLDGIAEKIKNSKKNEEPLSNFEKFMLAYEYVTQYVYNQGEDFLHQENSHWIPVMDGDKIICGGYASLIKALCERIFSQEEVKAFIHSSDVYDKKTGEYKGGHANNIIFIKDEKYGIDGLFYVDACWDSRKENVRDNKEQSYCCIPLQDILHEKKASFVFEDMFTDIYLSQYEDYKKDVDYNTTPFNKREKSFFDKISKEEKEYYNAYLGDFIEPNEFSFSPELSDQLNKYRENVESTIDDDFKDLFEIYKNVEIPAFSFHMREFPDIIRYVDVLTYENYDVNKFRESVSALAEICKKTDFEGVPTIRFGDFIKSTISNSILTKKREEIREKITIKNTKNMLISLNSKADSKPIPIEAFIKSYKIVGEMMGLKGDELKKYVKNRLTKSIEITEKRFDVKKCKNCFATCRMEDIKLGVDQKNR